MSTGGSSYMDQYESNYANNQYDATKRGDKDELGICTKYVFYIFYYVIFSYLLYPIVFKNKSNLFFNT